ncbi:MAG: PKD domain-containing protein [Bacteroidota bacterium]
MKKFYLLLLLTALFGGTSAFAQGGNTCAAAAAAPLTIPGTWAAQSTCGDANDYTGTNSTCIPTTYYNAMDWFYYFCAPANACINISLTNLSSGQNNQPAYASLSVFNACPGTLNACVGGNYQYLAANTNYPNGPSVQLNVTAGQCFYIVVDGYTTTGYANCFNYTLNITSTPPLNQTPGGNTCAAAQAAPLTIPGTITGQTTCCGGNDFTGTNSTCISSIYYNTNDWYYYFCATSNACITISLANMTSGSAGLPAYASLTVLNGCPGTGTCVGGGYQYLAANTTYPTGPSVQLNVTTGQCFYIVVDGYTANGYANCFNYNLVTTSQPALNQTPGGNTCSTAVANPITLGQTYTGQTTCCGGNDFTGTNSTCLTSTYYTGNDWYYYFCATQNGCVTVSMPNTSSGTTGQAAYPSISVLNGCPGTGTCIAGSYTYVGANTTVAGPSVNFNVTAGNCYYIVVDGYYFSGSYSNCVNYSLTTTFQPPLNQTPGGSSCSTAVANSMTLGQQYCNQSTCCGGNNYTGLNGCLSTTYYTANDWIYYVCANQTGYMSITLSNITASMASYPSLSVFSACPGTAGACVASNYVYVAANTSGTLTVTFMANANQCFYIVVDGYAYSGSYANCFNYCIQSTITPIPQNASCVNTDFEQGTLNGWFCTYGTAVVGCTACPCPAPYYNMTGIGAQVGRHTIMTAGTDPCGGFSVIGQGTRSLKLGNNLTGAQAEAVSQTFMVSLANASFTYRYAVVFEDPGHTADYQPFFRARLKDQNGNLIQCSQFCVSAASNLTGFLNSTTCTGVKYKPWTTVNVDLSAYVGQYVTIEFENGDCAAGGHYGYSYVDCSCAPSVIQANNDSICVGQCFTLTAPTGYASYSWSPGNNTTTAYTVCPTTTTVYTLTLTAFNGCTTQAFDTIAVFPYPVAGFTYSPNPVTCNTPVTFTNTSTITPSSPLTYSWSFPGGSPSSSTLQNPPPVTWSTPGTYTVTLTAWSPGGCSNTYTQTITIPACTGTVTATGGTICSGACMTLVANATSPNTPLTYSWSPNVGTTSSVNVCPTATTVYTVVATDAMGLTSTDTAIVTVIPPINITLTPTNILCNGGSNGSINATITGGQAPYTYSWSNGATTQNISNLTAGSYTLTVTSAYGCTGTANVTITQPPLLTVNASSTNVSCFGGNNGTLSATASGGTPAYTYLWTPGNLAGANQSNLAAGTYTITVTDANGCTATATTTITQPTQITATQSQVNVLCNGQCTGTATVTASGGTPGYTYTWSTVPPQYTATATGLCAGTYTCTIRDANGCTATSTFTITQPPVLNVSLTGTNVLCNGGNTGSATSSVTGGTPAYSYSWSNGQTTANATGLAAGTYTLTVTDANGCTRTATVTITQPTLLNATISASTNVSCNGGSNGSATVSASGGTPSYTYLWSNSQTGTTATGLSAGTYTVTVTDANGCTATATVTITQPPLLNVSLSGTNVLCNGNTTGSATSGVTGGTPAYSYSWSNGQTTANATGLAAGTYTLTVTDANGCTQTATVTITQPPLLNATISASTNVSCNGGSNGSATVSASGGTPSYTYLWSNSQTGTTATGLSAGTYTVTVTDANGCTRTATVTITQPPALTLSTSFTQATCGNANGSVSVTATGGTPAYSYSWSNGATTASVTGLAANIYSVVVTDANGCTATASVTVPNAGSPTVTITGQVNVLCNGNSTGSATASATGGTPGYTYSWSNSQTGTNATGLAAGTYTVTVTDANGCSAQATVTITQPPALTVSATGTNVLCFGGNTGSASASATGGTPNYTYVWSNAQTGANATGLAAGTYTVTVTDANGCTATSTVTITQPTLLNATISASTNVSCNGGSNGSATVSASGGTPAYSYSWSNGQTSTNATGLAAGTYTITVTDANGCTRTATVTITQPPALTLSTSFTQATCGNANGSVSVTASGGTPAYSYSWSNGATTASVTGLTANIYSVVVTDANGCTATASVTVPNAGSPSVTISSSVNVLCNGNSTGSATASASGGTPGYTYSWSNSQTGASATGLAAGTYTVTVTDANGCSAQTTITITQPPALTVSATGTNVLCFGGNTGSASASASGGTPNYTYVWSNAQSGLNATGLVAGTYTVTVTDANGCTAQTTVTITQPTQVTVTIPASVNVSCNGGSNGSATASGTGGTPAYTYSWSNSQTGANATGLAAGTYTVTVTDANGCTATATVTITQPTAITLSTTFTQTTCGNNNGSASVSATGGTPGYTYSWSNGATTAAISNLAVGVYNVTVTDANGCTATAIVNIPSAGSPTVTITSQVNVLCNGGNNGSAVSSATGGTPGYTYSWSNSQTGTTATGLSAGVYTVTVTDANGCTAQAAVTITQPPALAATLSGSPALCFGASNGSATSNVTGGTPSYTYSWSNGQTTANATGLAAGTYTLTVTDANNCTTTATVTITQPTQVTVTVPASANVLCNGGNNGSATASASGGTPGYTYSWSNAQTGATTTGLTAGTYTVIATDANGCTAQTTVTITEPTALAQTTSFVQSTCGNANGQACVTVTGGTGPYTYLWNNSGTTSCISNLSANTYSVVVTDANGCTITASVTVPNAGSPTVSISASANVSCNGGSNGSATATATGGTPGYTFSWNNSQTGATATGLAAGTYIVTVTDANGCSAQTTVTITQPPALTLSLSGSPALCFGASNGSATSTAGGGTPGYSYSWSNGDTNANTSGLAAGTYTLTVTDANGCTITSTVTITQPTQVTVSITASANVSCNAGNNGSATASAGGGTPGYTYSWSNSQTGANATGLTAGTYTVIATDANGCTAQTTVTITEPTALAQSTTFVQSTCGNANGQACVTITGGTPGYSYLWSNGGTTSCISNLMAGIYTVVATDANGCTITASVTVPNAGSPTVTIPASTNVSCNGGSNGTATATATGGTPGYNYSWSNGQTTATATGLAAGTYIITVTDANGCSAQATVTITQPTPLTLTLAGTPATCFGASNGSATSTAGGGTPGYSYSWSNGDTNVNTSGLAAGTYTLTVTDANGCTITATVTITEPTQVVASIISSTNVLCNAGNNGAATANATGGTPGYTYSWSNSQTGANATGLTAGTYTVYATDANGCTAQTTVTITEPTALAQTTSFVQSTCGNPNGSACISVTGGVTPYSYSWSNNGTANCISNLMAGVYTVVVTDANGCTITASVTVPNAGSPVISIAGSVNVLCFGGNNASASSSVTGGTQPYSYLWSNGQTNASATGLTAGVYFVTVTDSNGCTDSASVTITEPPLLTISATSANVLCNAGNTGSGTATAAGGTQPYSYLWSNGDTNANATGLVAGIYSVTVTDANGCTAMTSITVTEPPALTLSASGTAASCFGSCNGTASALVAGGTFPYAYSWSNNATASSLTGLCMGVYTITVTDTNGCVISDTAVVTEPTQIVLSATATQALCGNNNGTATVSATGGTPGYLYSWSNGQTTATASNLAPATYTVVVTDANGCTASITVTVTTPAPLAISISGTNVSCFGGSNGTATVVVTGGTPAYNYSWNNGGTTASISNLPIGTYFVIVTDQNGCSITAQVAITQPTQLTTTGSTLTYCAGGNGTVAVLAQGGTPGYTYSWNNGASTSMISIAPTVSTTYTVWVTDANGCTDIDSSVVTVNALPVISFYASDSSGCAPLCVTFTNTTPNTTGLFWTTTDAAGSGTVNNWQHCYNTPGSYDVSITVTDNNGCSSSQTVTGLINVYPVPVADFTMSPQPATILDPEICFTNTSVGATQYTWDFGDPLNNSSSNSSNLEDVCHLYSDTGTYCVTLWVSNADGCTDSAMYCLIIGPDFTFFAPNAFTPYNGDGNNDVWMPKGTGIDVDNYDLWIFDRWGNMIWHTDVWGKGWDGRANGGEEIAQIDTYVWKVNVKDIFGDLHQYVGHVSIIK